MSPKMDRARKYRHTPAFILLFLSSGDSYGAALLHTMERELPRYRTDTAVIYRSLQELEKEGALSSYWETDTAGPAKKWYRITEKGIGLLAEFKEDIEMRMANLQAFLDRYERLEDRRKSGSPGLSEEGSHPSSVRR